MKLINSLFAISLLGLSVACSEGAAQDKLLSELSSTEIDAVMKPLAEYDVFSLDGAICRIAADSDSVTLACEAFLPACVALMADPESDAAKNVADAFRKGLNAEKLVPVEVRSCDIPVSYLQACVDATVVEMDKLKDGSYTCESGVPTMVEPKECETYEAKLKELGCSGTSDAG